MALLHSYNNWREVAMAYRRRESQSAVAEAVRMGVLPPAKSLKCSDCGGKAVCYDHRDYRKPLRVDPVCKRCDSIRGPGRPSYQRRGKAYDKVLRAAKRWHLKIGRRMGISRQRAREIVNGATA